MTNSKLVADLLDADRRALAEARKVLEASRKMFVVTAEAFRGANMTRIAPRYEAMAAQCALAIRTIDTQEF